MLRGSRPSDLHAVDMWSSAAGQIDVNLQLKVSEAVPHPASVTLHSPSVDLLMTFFRPVAPKMSSGMQETHTVDHAHC